jgi:hypothetical protein
MSDARAIEAVTETMRSIVDAGVKRVSAGARAIAAPPHEVAASQEERINVFLYRTEVDGSLRNTDPPATTPGEIGHPALPLVLHYLLTPYAPDGNDLVAHRLLGGALQALHSHERLTSRDLADLAPFSDMSQQFEQVRISWQPLDDKDMYSLWSVFQAPYRVSAAFEVRVVQIDSRVRGTAPLPVLRRGSDGHGASVAADVDLAELTEVVPVLGQLAAQVGESVTVRGRALAGDTVSVVLTHPALSAPIHVLPDQVATYAVSFTVPTTMRAGQGTVSLRLVSTGAGSLITNRLPLAVAPKITSALPMTVTRTGSNAHVTLTCEPPVLAGQEVSLLLGSRPIPANPFTTETGTVSFTVRNAKPGTSPLRLRVSGTDSRLVVDRTQPAPEFDPSMRVTVT